MTIFEILCIVFTGLSSICVFFLIYAVNGRSTKLKKKIQPISIFSGLAFAITAEVFYLIDLWKTI